MAIATLASGCFWCTEAVIQRLRGVDSVVSGYTGGSRANPTYEARLRWRSHNPPATLMLVQEFPRSGVVVEIEAIAAEAD